MFKLTGIHIYPIKSLGGISLTESLAQERGLQYDRRWMLVDSDGVFMTQRKIAEMTLFSLTIGSSQLIVCAPDQSTIQIPLESHSLEMISVKVWNDECLGYLVDETYDDWFSEKLGITCRLVYMGENVRSANPKSVRNNEKVSYADGYQYLIVGQSSLDDLNERLEESVPMNRFRPNLVFSGGESFEEDAWDDFIIGSMKFYGIKACARCKVTTIDQSTAVKNQEPLVTLSKFRKWDNKIFFGLNASAIDEGMVRVGDMIEVLSKK